MPSLLTSAQNGRKQSRFRDINVTPMVDVMLVLLVIFMVTAPMMQHEIEVELPDADTAAVSQFDEPPIELTVMNDGTMMLGDQLADRASLKGALDVLMAEREDQMIYLRADGANTYSQVFEIMGLLQKMGYPNISLVGSTSAQ